MTVLDLLADVDRTDSTMRLLMAAQAVETQLLLLKRTIAEVAPAIAAAERRAERAEERAARAERKVKRLTKADERLIEAAARYLLCIEDLSTPRYALGEDRDERRALRAVLEDIGAVEPHLPDGEERPNLVPYQPREEEPMNPQQYAMAVLMLSALSQREDAFEGLDTDEVLTITFLLDQAHQAAVRAREKRGMQQEIASEKDG